MDAPTIIALSALGLSALTFVAMQFGGRRTATASYVQQLEKRVEKLEQEVARKDARIEELEDLNFRLQRRQAAGG